MKIIIFAAITLCLLILCSQCLAEETDYFDWKGLKSYAAKNYTDSIAYYDIAIKQDPTYIDAWLHKGDAQRALKDYNASLQSYEGALQVKNDTKAAWSGITEAYVAMKDFTNASIAAAKTTEIDNSKGNWLREGNLLQTQEMYQEAVSKYEGALTSGPGL